jgi:hypothetical protein
MNSEDIINQCTYARELSSLTESDELGDHSNVLNLLAISGFKLVKLTEEDFDEEGVSVVSKAYMYSAVENIESSHYNLLNLKEDKEFEEVVQDFDDYIEDDLDMEDDIEDE